MPKIGTWVESKADEIVDARERVKLPETINDRQWDSWEVLVAIADVAGGDWPKRAYAACEHITDASEDTRSNAERLIGDLCSIFSNTEGEQFIKSSVICDYLNMMEERPWSKWNKGKGFDTNALSRMLRPFKIKPRQKKQFDGSVMRGQLHDMVLGGHSSRNSYKPLSQGGLSGEYFKTAAPGRSVSSTKHSNHR